MSRPKAGFQTGCSLLEINVSVSHSSSFSAQVEAKRQILGPSGDIPQIKTALDDVCHRKKTWHIKILTRSGDFHLCTSCKLTKIRRKHSDCKFKIRLEIVVFSARKQLGNTLEKHWKRIHREKPAKHDFRRNQLRIDKVRLGKSTGDFRTKRTSEDSPKTQGKSAFGRPLPAGHSRPSKIDKDHVYRSKPNL